MDIRQPAQCPLDVPAVDFAMKKIEVVVDGRRLEELRTRLAATETDGSPTLREISVTETEGRYYQLGKAPEPRWKRCVKLDLIVPDSQTQDALKIVQELASFTISEEQAQTISIFSLEATREVSSCN